MPIWTRCADFGVLYSVFEKVGYIGNIFDPNYTLSELVSSVLERHKSREEVPIHNSLLRRGFSSSAFFSVRSLLLPPHVK